MTHPALVPLLKLGELCTVSRDYELLGDTGKGNRIAYLMRGDILVVMSKHNLYGLWTHVLSKYGAGLVQSKMLQATEMWVGE